MTHRLLILGTLGEFVQLVKKSKEKGYYTIVCDGYPDGPARELADASYVIPVTDIDAVANLCKSEKVDGIITSFSDLLLECMVKIADKAGIPCYLKPEQLKWYRDKSACRELLGRLGLPSPGFARIPVKFLKEKNSGELQRLTEEYNDGFEFNMMTWVQDGKVNVISIADREKTEMEEGMLPESTRNVYPSRLLDKVEKSAADLLQNYIGYTGQQEGALSMQFFWKPGKGIQVCEIAGRFFGYEHELTDMVYGFNIEELLLNYLYDKKKVSEMFKTHDIHRPQKCGAVLYFHGQLKTIRDQEAAYRLSEEAAVVKPWIFYKEGEDVIAYGPNPYLALYYIEAESREELDRITEKFFEQMSVTDPEGQEIVYKNKIPDYSI